MTQANDVPRVTREGIAGGLRRLGLGAGHRVMVHSSLKSFGRVVGGPEAVIAAIQDVVTADGTLMMPSFNHGVCYREGEAGYYDPLTTPTRNGLIPETFWRQEGVYRSWNPTHAFAAWGRQAEEYTRFHHRALTCGATSPLGLLAADGGFGLLLGVRYNSSTFHHVVEMSSGAPCLGPRTTKVAMKLPDGRMVEGRTWGWRDAGCPFTDKPLYGELMESRGLQRETMIGACRAVLFDLADCRKVLMDLFANGYGDLPPCSRCPARPKVGPRTVASDWDEERQCLKSDSAAWGY